MERLTENETFELKREVTADICKEVIGFANTHGGQMIVGIGDNGEIVGVEDPDQTILRINNLVRDSIKPDLTMFVRYTAEMQDGKHIIRITIQKGTDRPYYLASKGLRPSGVYMRNGTSTDPATDTAIRKMIKETDGDTFENMRSLEQALTFSAAKAAFEKCGTDFDQTKMRTLGLISSDGVYSNAGLLLSDQCPYTIKAAAFAGKDKDHFQDRREFVGSLFQQVEDLYAYLDLHNQTRADFDGLYRIDRRDYPVEAIREVLLNAVVHRDYAYSASTLVSIYSDRIEFVSVGGLPQGIEKDDIFLGLSICRNKKIAEVFYRLHFIEAYGTGVPKIIKAYEDSGCEPKIEVSANAFKVMLPNRNAECNLPITSNEEGHVILTYLQTNDRITRAKAEQLLQTSQATTSRLLKKLQAEGIIVQTGNGRNTAYRLKK